jgi:GTP-binding protein
MSSRPTAILGDKEEILALNKVDALDPETRAAKAAELEAISGVKPYLISGVSGRRRQAVLRRILPPRCAEAALRARDRGRRTDEPETPGGWTPS